ncbi:MAG: 2OG-Fe(II) oxygenase [Candidatus Methylopumilus sp.]|nr:2OG-Fe(II) oxygenase [Candidatus Methylopumilus sp.]
MLTATPTPHPSHPLSQMAENGFCVLDNFISPDTVLCLAAEISALNSDDKMQAARTGRLAATVNLKLRGVSIHWLDENHASLAQLTYFKKMEGLRCQLNQQLYLGLHSLECHLALYPIGSAYPKHLDRFQLHDDSHLAQRQISCILYLNQDWLAEDGGYLRLHLNDDGVTRLNIAHLDIAPIAGRLIVFLSDSFYHEVLPTHRARMSLTAWFLNRQAH